MPKIFGGTKLGLVSTIVSIVGTVLVGAGSIGSTLNNNIVVKKTAEETCLKQISQ